MHYKDGTEAKLGDICEGVDYNRVLQRGVVVKQYEGSDTCNLVVGIIKPCPAATIKDGAYVLSDEVPHLVVETRTFNANECNLIVRGA